MSLTFCPDCQCVEGGKEEREVDGEAWEVCAECGSTEVTGIPEHDDWDMER